MPNLPSNLIDDCIIAVATGINKGVEVFKDGFQFQDLFQFIPTALSIQSIVENKDELMAQIKDYSLEERAKSIEKVRELLQWENEKAEKMVGHIYDVVFGMVSAVITLTENKA